MTTPSEEISSAPTNSAARVATRGFRKPRMRPAPRSAIAKGSRRLIPSTSKPPQLGHVQMVKGVSNAERKDSHQQQPNENVEEDSDFDNQGHPERCRQRRQKDAVLQNKQSEHLHQSLVPADHQERARQNQGHGRCKGILGYV